MKKQPRKYRIKVIKKNNDTIMYHPQVWLITDIKYGFFFEWFGWDIFSSPRYKYDWRGLINESDGLNTCDKKNDDGNGYSNIELAYKEIEQYKIDSQKRYEKAILPYKEIDSTQISYINI